MKYLIAVLLFVLPAPQAFAGGAGAYLDLGLGYALGSDARTGVSCLRDYSAHSHAWGCSQNPLGTIGAGYEFANGVSVGAEHWTSLTTSDYGMNLLTVKYRLRAK